MAMHDQSWVKVNALVDSQIAELVRLLNVPTGIMTLQSCQGDRGNRGYVYFTATSWRDLGAFLFDTLAPQIGELETVSLSLDYLAGRPIAKLGFSAEIVEPLTAALKEAVSYERP